MRYLHPGSRPPGITPELPAGTTPRNTSHVSVGVCTPLLSLRHDERARADA